MSALAVQDDNVPTQDVTPLPTAMTSAAFVGIAWYIAIELNVRLIATFKRRGVYFWSCILCSWGILIHSLAVILANFNVWEDYSSVVVIHITWCFYVVSNSVVLYSRLNLVLKRARVARWVLYMIIFTSVVFGLGTVILGMIARYPSMVARLGRANLVWDKVQVTAFFLQETLISILYILETRRHLESFALLGTDPKTTRSVLTHLIYINVFIIILDCSLIGLCYAGFFFLQGFYKVAVYAVKLRTEYSILNQLRSALPNNSRPRYGYSSNGYHVSGTRNPKSVREIQDRRPCGSQASDIQMVNITESKGGIRVQTELEVTKSKRGDHESDEISRDWNSS